MKIEMVTYQAGGFSEAAIASRYITASDVLGMVKVFDVDAKKMTIRESFVRETQFAAEEVIRADLRRGQAFGKIQVEVK